MVACTDQSGASGPDLVSVGFGTGASGCTLTGSATTFPVGSEFRSMLEMSPPLPIGGTVTLVIEKDGAEVHREVGEPVTEPRPCMSGTWNAFAAGHYRFIFTITPSQMAPATGEFDITP